LKPTFISLVGKNAQAPGLVDKNSRQLALKQIKTVFSLGHQFQQWLFDV
jgi:hypothetical protein